MHRPFAGILEAHRARYPLMEPRDYAKLCYQSEYGPEHIIEDEDSAYEAIAAEWAGASGEERAEDIGGGLCRFHLGGEYSPEKGMTLARLLCRTAKEHRGGMGGLEEKLALLEGLGVDGMEAWLADYRKAGRPAVRHSEAFREAYRPHYRLLKAEYAGFFPALVRIAELAKSGGPNLVAIDGRCGSGKTAFAGLISELFPCSLIHADDFFLPPGMRREDWREQPGGNMDFPRLREVILPLLRGEAVDYAAYDCQRGRLAEPVVMEPKPLVVLEGSYSHHPDIGVTPDLKLFVTCPGPERRRRLRAREGEYYEAFESTWIPMEELYIGRLGIGRDAMAVDAGGLF